MLMSRHDSGGNNRMGEGNCETQSLLRFYDSDTNSDVYVFFHTTKQFSDINWVAYN